MKKTLMIAAMLAVPVMLSGCGKKAEAPKAEASPDTMGSMAMPDDAKMAKSTGTVTAIDAASGMITLEHDATLRIAKGDKIAVIQVRNQQAQRVRDITQEQALQRDGRSR